MSIEILRKGSKKASNEVVIDTETKEKVEELEKAIKLIASTKLIDEEVK